MLMEMLKLFAKIVFNPATDGSFQMCGKGGNYYYFMQCKVCDATYIFRIDCYTEPANLTKEAKLTAIVADGLIYLIDDFCFGRLLSYEDFPAGVQLFSDKLKEINNEVNLVIIREFFDGLPTNLIKAPKRLDYLKQLARKILLEGEENPYTKTLDPIFDESDLCKILCGQMDMKEEALERLNAKRDVWVEKKGAASQLETYFQSPDLIAPWEQEMANALANTEAVQVVVEFTFNGITDSIKAEPDTIRHLLAEKDDFSYWNFSVAKEGEAFLKKLGVSNSASSTKLYCFHITRILYRGKPLYERQKVIA